MQPFITFRDSDNGQLMYFVLQRSHPNYVVFVSEEPIINVFQPVPVSGYKLWIVFWGVVSGKYIPGYADAMKEIEGAMWNMSEWFYRERILKDEKKYKKFKIDVSGSNK